MQESPSNYETTIKGLGFMDYPGILVGYLASNNSKPMANIGEDYWKMEVQVVSDEEIILRTPSQHQFSMAQYVGTLYDSTHGQVVWVNESRPLP